VGGTDPPGIAYVYAPDCKAERPIIHLAAFKGIPQVDGYGGCRVLTECGDVQLAFRWSHVRRRFYELAAAGSAPIASEALERIADLYAVEKDIRGRSADERGAMRQNRSRPIIDELEPLTARQARLDQPEDQARRGDPLCALALGWAYSSPRRRPRRDRFQRNGTQHSAHRVEPKECAVRRLRRRRRTLGGRCFADRDLQTQLHLSLRLSR
jgi:hypothetical protein